MSATVEPDRILKDLRVLWRDLARQEESDVLRACAMTLVVVDDNTLDERASGETLAALMHEHPCRLIVVGLRPGAGRTLEGTVSAQCWRPFGRRQQICCEQIEITASREALADAAAVIRGLIVSDLPVVVYCPCVDLWSQLEFADMGGIAGKLILDSSGMPSSTRVLSYLSSLPARIRRADLVWSRLTPIREAISGIFDQPANRRGVFNLSEIRILYKGAEETAAVYYLAGWFMHVLGAATRIKIAAGVGPEYMSIAHVTLQGPNLEATVEVIDGTIETRLNGEISQITLLPAAGEYEALAQELGVAGRDPVFEDVLGLAHLLRGASS